MQKLKKNKFIYYKLKNKNNDIYYHGIIDIELNKIIFNTNETITTFIPYSNMAMLAITPKTVYRICTYILTKIVHSQSKSRFIETT